jgi:hypothetical protein
MRSRSQHGQCVTHTMLTRKIKKLINRERYLKCYGSSVFKYGGQERIFVVIILIVWNKSSLK